MCSTANIYHTFSRLFFSFLWGWGKEIDGVEAIEARLLRAKETVFSHHCEFLGEEANHYLLFRLKTPTRLLKTFS